MESMVSTEIRPRDERLSSRMRGYHVRTVINIQLDPTLPHPHATGTLGAVQFDLLGSIIQIPETNSSYSLSPSHNSLLPATTPSVLSVDYHPSAEPTLVSTFVASARRPRSTPPPRCWRSWDLPGLLIAAPRNVFPRPHFHLRTDQSCSAFLVIGH